MRISRKTGLLVSTAVCGALALGTAGPAFSSAPEAPARSAAAAVPVPGAEQLAGQTKLLGDAGGVLTPVTELLDVVLQAPDGKLPEADAKKHGDAVKAAIGKVTEAAPKAPEGVALPVGGAQAADPGADLKAKATADLQAKVDALLAASAKGDAKATAAAVQATVTATVNVLVSITLGGGLPKANLPGLPEMPAVPGVDALPALPGV